MTFEIRGLLGLQICIMKLKVLEAVKVAAHVKHSLQMTEEDYDGPYRLIRIVGAHQRYELRTS
jgi:hypothetical protein